MLDMLHEVILKFYRVPIFKRFVRNLLIVFNLPLSVGGEPFLWGGE